jgi:K+-sensing histidine kinase KdpD
LGGSKKLTAIKNILVCITQQKTCERLIRKASEIRNNRDVELFVIHVAKNDWNFLDNVKEGEALEYLFGISKSVGANLFVLKSDEIVKTISEFARENHVGSIVMGESGEDIKDNAFYNDLKGILNNLEFYIIPQAEK